ncbi:hypothetical protein J6590_074581 [Homalodisca vitripennis]|nr:hypothetical protein J6590_074581 [Homalodisca vitripennis]
MAPVTCGKCNENLPRTGDTAVCCVCGSSFQLDKCSVNSGTDKKDWSSSRETAKDVEDFEVSSLGIQQTILKPNFSRKFPVCESRTSIFKKQLDALQKKKANTKERAETQAVGLADLDQYGRRLNLKIHGLTIEGNQGQEGLWSGAREIDVRVRPEDVHQTRRPQCWCNTRVCKRRKSTISAVYFNENVCPFCRNLLREAKIRARIHSFAFVLFRGGRLLVKRRENDKNVDQKYQRLQQYYIQKH